MRRVCLFTTPFPFMQAINSGIAACSKRVGPWRIEVQSFRDDDSVEQFLNSRVYDGIILTYRAPFAQTIVRTGVHLVGALVDPEGIPHCGLDEAAVGVMGAKHLLECGYRKFAFFGSTDSWSLARYRGFHKYLKSEGFTPFSNISLSSPVALTEEQSQPAGGITPEDFVKLLEPPVAVMACNDYYARGIVDFAIQQGMRLPGDLAVMGVDNDEICCETGACPLTSIDTDLYRVGFEAALILDRLMRREDRGNNTSLIGPKEVVRRQSTSLFAHEDPDIASALRFIHEHACEGITVTQVCEHIALSRRRFEQRFFDAVGHCPGYQIRQVRAERAKSLLTETNMNLSQISVRCGYAYISGFSAAFRSVVGMSPSEYRRQHEDSSTPKSS